MSSPEPYITVPKLEAIGAVDARDLLSFIQKNTDISYEDRRELFTKLYQRAVKSLMTTVQAKDLPDDVSYAGRHIRFVTRFGMEVEGIITAADKDEAGDVCVKVNGKFYIVKGDNDVDVWPSDEPRVCGKLIGDHQAYGRLICDQVTGHTSAHQQSNLPEQCEKTRGGIQCALNDGHHFAPNATPHQFSNALNILRGQRRNKKEKFVEYSAEFVRVNIDVCEFRNREVEVRGVAFDGPVRGKLTDAMTVQTSDGGQKTIIFVVDGQIYCHLPTEHIKIFNKPKPPCDASYPHEDRILWCENTLGHSGPHIYNNCC